MIQKCNLEIKRSLVKEIETTTISTCDMQILQKYYTYLHTSLNMNI